MTSEDQIKAVLAKHIKPWEMDGFPCVTGIPEATAEIAALASNWRLPDAAPPDKEVEVRVGAMTFLAKLVPGGGMNMEGATCDQWQATREGEHPPCWSDGGCYESNADEAASLPVEAWRPVSAVPASPRSGAGEGEDLFDGLRIESMVREWCAPLLSGRPLTDGVVDALVDVLRMRLRRADPNYRPASKAARAALVAVADARGLIDGYGIAAAHAGLEAALRTFREVHEHAGARDGLARERAVAAIASFFGASPPAPAEHGALARFIKDGVPTDLPPLMAAFSFPQPQRARMYDVLLHLGQAAIRSQKITDHDAVNAAQRDAMREIEALVTKALSQGGQAGGSEKGKGEEDGRVTSSPGSREPSETSHD